MRKINLEIILTEISSTTMNVLLNDDNQWTVEVKTSIGYFCTKSSSVQFKLGENMFQLTIRKRGTNIWHPKILAKIISLNNVAFGFKAQVTAQHDSGAFSEQLCFSTWKIKHTVKLPTLATNFVSLQQSTICVKIVFCNFAFICEGKVFPAFKEDMIEQSTVFERMLKSLNWKETKEEQMLIEDFDSDTVENLVYFLNFKRLARNSKCCIFQLLLIADKYDISVLYKLCQAELAIHLDHNNCFQILDFAVFIQERKLQEACLCFILEDWFKKGTSALQRNESQNKIYNEHLDDIIGSMKGGVMPSFFFK